MKKLTTEEFIKRAIEVHDDKYDYSKVEYKNNTTKVKIICPIDNHGDFYQQPQSHLIGKGCKKCYDDQKKTTIINFIQKAEIIHNNKYDYSKVNYKHSHSKVTIICPIGGHGEFKQQPSIHLIGHGCRKCYDQFKNYGLYNLHLALQGHYKFSGYLYIIKMFNIDESFIKIGISINPKHRFKELKINSKYNIEIIETQFFEDFNLTIIKEHELHVKYKKFQYIPENKFGGWTECFNYHIIFNKNCSTWQTHNYFSK